MQTQSTTPFDHWNLTPAQRDSLEIVFHEIQQLKNENIRLKKELRSRDLDITKLKADLEYQIDRNNYLKEEIQIAMLDLELVEKQFISIEKQLQSEETKASAVAVLAEVKLNFDILTKEDSSSVNSDLYSEIQQKLRESEELIQKKNYAASAYYAKRAQRLLEQLTNENRLVMGETKIVSVSKANLRSGPGFDHEIIEHVDFGTILIQIGQVANWSRIKTKDGNEGWIHKTLLR